MIDRAFPLEVLPERFEGLREITWNRDPASPIKGADALALYERNWHRLDPASFSDEEACFLDELVRRYGNGVLLV